jgi:hypothetical protein
MAVAAAHFYGACSEERDRDKQKQERVMRAGAGIDTNRRTKGKFWRSAFLCLVLDGVRAEG